MTRKPWFWPAFVVGILVLGVGVNVVLLVVANSDPSFAVEEDYYDKALRWDEKRARDAASAALGWSFDFAAVPDLDAADGAPVMQLTVAVRDADGAAVDGAAVRLETFHLARSAEVDRTRLEGRGDGLYRATLPLRRAGIWEFRFEVVAGDDTFTHREQREVGAPWPRS
jgi:nitrogen fixation protein FixH